MKKHTKIYYEFFNYDLYDFVPCEITGVTTNDIHHIDCKGMGGSKEKDFIENLMASARDPHVIYGDKSKYMNFLNQVHVTFMQMRVPYIEINPHHEAFNALLHLEKFKHIIQWWRQQ